MGSPEIIADIQPYAELHRGTTTTVYKGFQKSLDRFVLLKVLHPEFSQDEGIARRFQEEARLAARVQHPNIVSIYSYGIEGQTTYIATEFVEGVSLDALIEDRALPIHLATYVLFEAVKGLKAAHDQKVLHRDIKPSNLLIARSGEVKLTDFGMASFVNDRDESNQVRGTLAYLAPELILGDPPGPASDLFSLGATFFEMLTGKQAFKGRSSSELFDAVLNHDPSPLLQEDESIFPQLRRICLQLLRKKSQQRYQDCRVLLADLAATRKVLGSDIIGKASEMQKYLQNPDEYKSTIRRSSLSVRATTPSRAKTRPPARKAANKSTGAGKPGTSIINRSRVVSFIALVLFLGVGFSVTGSFFFGKDGQFGGRGVSTVPSGSSSEGEEARTAPAEGAGEAAAPKRGEEVDQRMPPRDDSRAGTAKIEEAASDSVEHLSPASPNPPMDSVVVLSEDISQQAGRVHVDAVPWAVVYFEGDSVGVTPLPMVVGAGSYRITLVNPDFPPFETLVDVMPGGDTPLEVSLWSLVGRLQVEVYPFAKVYVNEEYHDETPLSRPLIVAPGKHTLTMVHPTLGSFSAEVEITAGEQKTVRFNLTEMS